MERNSLFNFLIINIREAFDSIERGLIWKCLDEITVTLAGNKIDSGNKNLNNKSVKERIEVTGER